MAQPQKLGVDGLESFFHRFPDVPREVIVKEDLLRLGTRFTTAALGAVSGARKKTYYLFAWDRAEDASTEERQGARAPQDYRIQGGPYGLRTTVVRNRSSDVSPYVVDLVDGRLTMCLEGHPIAQVECTPEPGYYSRKFEDGTPYYELAATNLGGYGIFVTPFHHCQHWDDGSECKYCDIGSTVRLRKKVGKKIGADELIPDVNRAAEAVAAAFSERWENPEHGPKAIVLSGGSIAKPLRGMNEVDFYLEYVRAIRERAGGRWPLCLVIEAADKESMKRVREAGVSCFSADFEVWDEGVFKALCPGKARHIGRETWIRRILDSVDVMGEGNVIPCFVAGVEMAQPYGFRDVDSAVKSTTEGLEFFMSHGVLPKPITWTVSSGSALARHEPPPLEYLVRLLMNWYELWKKYRLPPFTGYGPTGPGRAVYYTSACNDMADARSESS